MKPPPRLLQHLLAATRMNPERFVALQPCEAGSRYWRITVDGKPSLVHTAQGTIAVIRNIERRGFVRRTGDGETWVLACSPFDPRLVD